MDKVYLVVEQVPYEGDTEWGVFRTQEKADKAIKEILEHDPERHMAIYIMDLDKCYPSGFRVWSFVEAFKKAKKKN